MTTQYTDYYYNNAINVNFRINKLYFNCIILNILYYFFYKDINNCRISDRNMVIVILGT